MTCMRWPTVRTVVGLIALCSAMAGNVGAALAQSPPPTGDPQRNQTLPTRGDPAGADAGVMAPVIDWLERANREYQDTVVQQLSVPTGRGGDSQLPKAKDQAPTPSQSEGGARSVVQQLQDWLGLGEEKTVGAAAKAPSSTDTVRPEMAVKGPNATTSPEQSELERRAADDAVRRQREARALEAQRTAEEQRLTAAAKKAQDAVDVATRQRQLIAETARLAEEQRRTAGSGSSQEVAAKAPAANQPAAAAAQLTARETAKSQSDKANIETAEAETARTAKAKAKQDADAAKALQKAPEKAAARPADGPSDSKPQVAEQNMPNPDSDKRDSDARAAERLAIAANRAGSSAMENMARTGKGQKVTHIGAAQSGRETKHRTSGRRKCQNAGEEVDPPATYVVKRGDTLWSISRRHYDKGHRFDKIVRANDSRINDPDLIFPCQKLMLPS